jgi:aminomethyltransferase
MPVQYRSIVEEHLAVRKSAGVFDISHMGEFFVYGPGAAAWLDTLLTNRVEALAVGQGHYTLMLNDAGGVIDDLILYRFGDEEFFLVVNASMIEEDAAWMRKHLPTSGVTFSDESAQWAALAVQGPAATSAKVLASLGVSSLPPRNGIARLCESIVCRTGYTGEDGFEFFVPVAKADEVFATLLTAGVALVGLGARDSLRLEKGYPLNGNDLSPQRTPLEAGLGFFVDLEKPFFHGQEKLREQKGTMHDRLCGLRLVEPGPPLRAHYEVQAAGEKIGELTSGGLSPSLGYGIGMAYLPPRVAKIGTRLDIIIRAKAYAAEVVKKPFYQIP